MFPTPFEIAQAEDCTVATDGKTVVSARDGGTVWRRRAVRTSADTAEISSAIEMCVVELNGVRVYVSALGDQNHVIVTTKDIWP